MDASVRKSLKTLQGLLDEGFITKAEFTTRRKAVLDSVTGVEKSTAAPSKGSVFSRLGASGTEATGTTGGDKWQHDKYSALYTSKPASKKGTANKPLTSAIAKKPADLRAKLGGGKQRKLPAKCPW
jgi:hypothetical protein